MQSLERVMEPFEAGDALSDRESWFHGLGHRAQPRQSRQIAMGLVVIHVNAHSSKP